MPEGKRNLDAAREALLAIGDRAAAEWLALEDGQPEVRSFKAADGSDSLAAGGILQDSRAGPRAIAEGMLERSLPGAAAGECSLFGLGSPALARLLLERTSRLTALEPAASVARAFLGLGDFSREIASGKLRLLTPWAMADGAEAPLSPLFVSHPASRRRDPAMCRAFSDLVRGRSPKGPAPGETPRILVAPPFSGGTLSMGPFLAKAAGELKADGVLLAWPEELSREAEAAKAGRERAGGAPGAPPPAGIFRKCARFLAGKARDFKPHLILALAQAPLDEGGAEEVKDACPDSFAAFWFAEDFRRFSYARGIAAAWDLFLHIQGNLMDRALRDWGVRRAAYLPPCADSDFFRPRGDAGKFRARVSFMGAAYPNRLRIFSGLDRALRARGLAEDGFRIFGSGWGAAAGGLGSRLFEGGRRLSPEETALVFAGGEVNLNVHSGPGDGFDPASGFVNPRAFELAAAGAFQLSDPRPLMDGLFAPGEIAVSPSPEELPDLVMDWLDRPADRARAGAAARARALGGHLYRHRLDALMKMAFGA
ncbi:MAG: glycosyltransferase [Deltaproteobacteria bacterium]|nr:glycosyltransferase [Deltaproteobacteria bacterium]